VTPRPSARQIDRQIVRKGNRGCRRAALGYTLFGGDKVRLQLAGDALLCLGISGFSGTL
jgi:hypothetical protein